MLNADRECTKFKIASFSIKYTLFLLKEERSFNIKR